MASEVVVPLVSAALAAGIAIAVPWLAFRFALRQDHRRWVREQRATLYVDLLVNAHAEREGLKYLLADDEQRALLSYEDVRPPAVERARLGARGSAVGSRDINKLFAQFEAVVMRARWRKPPSDGDMTMTMWHVDNAFDALQAQIRRELTHEETG